MIELSQAQISALTVNKVGNKSRDEGVMIARELYDPEQELMKALNKYFFKPFRTLEDSWKFVSDGELADNAMFSVAEKVFENPAMLFEQTGPIINHLYEQSEHPHIKPGEVYLAYITDCVLEGELVEAIGIFKTESRDTFLKIRDRQTELDITVEKGVNIRKLDKGALIFNTEAESGYRVFTVDQNNYDAQYWIEDFLGVEPDQNEVFHTRAVVDLCQDFAHEVIGNEIDRKEEVMFVQKAMDYLEENEQFSLTEFADTVIKDENQATAFKAYKKQYEQSHELEPIEDFEISMPVMKKAKSQVKPVINLDTNIQIKLNFNDPESGNKFIEKGYDDERGMYFYTVYFNREE